MKNLIAAGAVLAASIAPAAADLCSVGAKLINGNWYCQPVKAITYQGVGGSGSYNKVTHMDSSTGSCSSTPQRYSGSMAPYDDEVSLHFRGPVTLKQFAVYVPSSSSPSSSSKSVKRSPHQRRHGHEHFHHRNKEIRAIQERDEQEKRDAKVGDLVIATINGAVVSWINKYDGGAAATAKTTTKTTAGTTAAASATTLVTTTAAAKSTKAPKAELSLAPPPPSSSSKTAASAPSPAPVASGAWGQIAYYNAKSRTANGLVFLNHMGGQGSGVFDYVFGNSLSYASADAKSGCSSPEVLTDATIPSNVEVVIMSDKECTGGSCGYTRNGTVAHHGFGGAQKAFFFEFAMPFDKSTGYNADMPAIWMLNAQIPRTLQYGKAECNCWTSGCGEFDLFEVLDSGNTRCKSTLHGNLAGGDSDYFDRPTSSTIKAAVVFYNEMAHIQILNNDFDFGASMSADAIAHICNSGDTESKALGVSLFKVS